MIGIGLYLCLLLTAAIYWPGLGSPFTLDDIPNLIGLSQFDQVDTAVRIKQFVLSGGSGPTGRPLSLLSFMINDTNWPTLPWGFKYTNLMIHLLNGVLIFILSLKLCEIVNCRNRKKYWIALATCSIWLVHPLNVSTTLYVIQRMTQLSALFTLIGILGYLQGRQYMTTRPVFSVYYMTFAVVFSGLLAILSKENGVLLILYIAVLELTLFRQNGQKSSRLLFYWHTGFILFPIVLITGYFAFKMPGYISSYADREFTMSQRLLTETKILGEYITHILLPRLGAFGIFHDDYPISSNLFTPNDTFIYVLVTISALMASIIFRKKHPVISFAIIWFFAGHILESTFIPLELYFEHRNYLPMVGIIWAVTYYAFNTVSKIKPYIYTGLSLVILLLAAITYNSTWLWGHPVISGPTWASEHPGSIRAQQFASAAFTVLGDNDKAREHIVIALQYHPHDSSLLLQLIQLDCHNGSLNEKLLLDILPELTTAKYQHGAITTMMMLGKMAKSKTCQTLTPAKTREILTALIKNPAFQSKTSLHALYYWIGQLYAADRMLFPAIENLDIAHNYMGVIDIPLQQAVWLSSAGLYDDALRYVDKAEQIDNRIKNPFLRHTRRKHITNLRKQIQQLKRIYLKNKKSGK